ncbi:ABC transporter permease subunit [Bradyrhizobium sp. sBnM-33]|uniref:ABC transporter permease subunit n=1 Tax=Bradyrhizobium sp. sBnM-33 TaxID=2831780 RepID=UPI001BCEF194|nr:ABC transporter permease subunit [Bradyrhizobium sp. sBnM-33]WOH52484.1 ABC transporter permease subunit [Bradyrhizobium sp. sBnM-33]
MEALQKFGRIPTGLTVPAIAILLVIFGVPTVQLFLTSVNAPSFSVVNYQAFFEQQGNVVVLFQTIKMSVVATAICVIVGYPTAYLIMIASKPVRTALIVLVFIPWLTSGLVRTYAWTVILGDRGLINNVLLELGLISSPLSLLYNRLAVYIGMVHIMLPVMILPLLSVMQGIDKSLVAAARSMGARPSAAFWRVFFPLSLPGVRSGALLVFVVCLGFYITPQALGGLRDALLSNFIAAQVASSVDFAPIAAAAFILLAIAVVMLSMFGLDFSGTQGHAGQPVRKSWQSRLSSLGALLRYLNEIAIPYRARRWTAHLYQAGGESSWSKIAGALIVLLVMIYLLFPGLIVIIMSFSAGAFLEFPPSGFSFQWYRSFFGDLSWTRAFWDSLQIGVTVTILSTIAGTLAAFGLARTFPRLRTFLMMVILTPITFPAIVVGVAVYLGLANLGLIGTKTGIVLAHSIGSIAYVVVIVTATLANLDQRLEQAAKSMRAGPVRTFMRVTLPLIRPGIIGGAVFAFIHSFDEVIVTSLVSGFSIRTLPLKMLENINQQIDPTIAAVGSLLTLMPVLWLIALYVTLWRSRLRLQGASVNPVA